MNLTTPITTKTTTTTTTTATATVVCLQHNPSLMPGRILQDVAAGVVIHVLVYPLVTDDPNMIEKKTAKLTKCLFRKGKAQIFAKNSSYSTRMCTNLGISEPTRPFFKKIEFQRPTPLELR